MRRLRPSAHVVAFLVALAAGGLARWSVLLGFAVAALTLTASLFRLRSLRLEGNSPPRGDVLAAASLALVTAAAFPPFALARDPYHALSPAAVFPMFAVAAAAISSWSLVLLHAKPQVLPETSPIPPPAGLARAIRFGLFAYAVLLPLSIAGMQIALGILAVLLALALALGARAAHWNPLDAPIALLFCACFLSIAFSSAPTPPWQTTACFALLSFFVASRALALVSGNDPAWLGNLCVAWALSSAATCTLAFVQHWTGFDLVARLGMRGPIRVEAPNVPGYFAGIGTFNSRLTLAHVTLLVASMVLGLILLRAAPRRRWILALCLALELAGLWSTLARAAWLSLASALLLAGALAAVGLRARRVLPALVGIAAAAVLALSLSPGARRRAVTALSFDNNRDRLFLWARGAEVSLAHPLLGVGFGSYQRLAGPIYDRYDPKFPMRTWAHNQALSLLCETGPLGLLAYLWILTATLAATLRALRRRTSSTLKRALGLGGALAATTFFVVGLFHDPLYDGEVAYNLFFALSLAASGDALN